MSGDGASQFHGNPLILDDAIYFGTDEGSWNDRGSLYALNRHDGELLWKMRVRYGAPSDPVAWDSLVYIVNYVGQLLALNVATGDTVWTFDGTPPADRSTEAPLIDRPKPKRGKSNPLIHGDLIIYHGGSRELYALDRRLGDMVWTHLIEAKVTTQITLLQGAVVYGTEKGQLVYVGASDGHTVGEQLLEVTPKREMRFLHDGLIFLAARDGRNVREVISIDPLDSREYWSVSLDDPNPKAAWYSPRVHIWRDNTVVGSTTGQVTGYRASNGSLSFRFKLVGRIRGIGSHEDILYVGTFEGMLYALRVGP